MRPHGCVLPTLLPGAKPPCGPVAQRPYPDTMRVEDSGMRRREFIGVLGGSALVWSLPARAQQPRGSKRVAILNGNAEDLTTRAYVTAFQAGLAEKGWKEGGNIGFDIRW